MSLRTFARRFAEATGSSPGEWLAAERIEAAKRLLVERRLDIDEIAAAVGMGSADTLRHHFRKHMGVSPTAYRDQFGPDLAARRYPRHLADHPRSTGDEHD